MKSTEVVVGPDGGGFNGPDRALAEFPGVQRHAVPYLNFLGDDSCVMLYRATVDDPGAVQRRLDEREDVRSCAVFETGAGDAIYVHAEPAEPLTSLLTTIAELGLVVDYPIPFTEQGTAVVVIAGTEGDLRQAIAAVPEAVGVTVERLGDYDPTPSGVLSRLTSRQYEALAVAFEAGYYRIPREITYEELAERLDCTPSTANSLLRNAEATIVAAHLAPDCGDGG